ncbi:MAG: energy transducer TonB [Chitinivibrionales bacterium]
MGGADVYTTTMNNSKPSSFTPVIVFSIAFHIFVLLVVPLTIHMFWKPREYSRPKTFHLVRPAIPKAAPKPPAPQVKEPEPVAKPLSEPKPAPKPEPRPVEKSKPTPAPKPQPQPEPEPPKEDLSELSELLGGLPVPAAELSMGEEFKYGWYINAIRSKIEQNWKPSIENPDLSVVVQFIIMANGTIGDVTVKRSSGSASLDNMALRAVKMVKQFPKLPPGFSKNQLTVECTLRPTRR